MGSRDTFPNSLRKLYFRLITLTIRLGPTVSNETSHHRPIPAQYINVSTFPSCELILSFNHVRGNVSLLPDHSALRWCFGPRFDDFFLLGSYSVCEPNWILGLGTLIVPDASRRWASDHFNFNPRLDDCSVAMAVEVLLLAILFLVPTSTRPLTECTYVSLPFLAPFGLVCRLVLCQLTSLWLAVVNYSKVSTLPQRSQADSTQGLNFEP
ncbi:hypothetical protein EI94DRAFT_1089313 [Lactarius quietus]|nr:hypothetical protein EI94DRAFT_1089313 [Lactarius quietus]